MLCRVLKSQSTTAAIPVILTAGRMDGFSREDALREGADRFLIKPFEASELLAMVEAEIERVTAPGFVVPAPLGSGMKAERAKSEPTKAELAKSEPVKAERAKPEPVVEMDYASAWLAATTGDEPLFVTRSEAGEGNCSLPGDAAQPEAAAGGVREEEDVPWL